MKSFDEIEKVILDPPSMSDLVDALAELRRAYEKQVAQRPADEPGFSWKRCPACGGVAVEPEYDYCPDCGQALDWSKVTWQAKRADFFKEIEWGEE